MFIVMSIYDGQILMGRHVLTKDQQVSGVILRRQYNFARKTCIFSLKFRVSRIVYNIPKIYARF